MVKRFLNEFTQKSNFSVAESNNLPFSTIRNKIQQNIFFLHNTEEKQCILDYYAHTINI